jgi:predicted XRE-type DNA-binding protein
MKATISSGNVFKDLGFGPEEAEYLRVRAMLMNEVGRVIRRMGWSQAEAARKMGVTQPRISDLMRGKIDVFSVEALIEMLSLVGLKVNIHVTRAKAA